MIELGHYSLVAALLLCSYATVAASVGGYKKSLPLVRSAENALVAQFLILAVASVCLWYLLFTDQFQVEYVAGYSSLAQPTIYKFTAFWGGQQGSLLLWSLVLGFFSFLAVTQNRHRHRQIMPYAASVMAGTCLFFASLVTFAANPFKTLGFVPPDGQGLNPLLQNWYMNIHPPMVYLGLVCLTIPFAFAMGALMSGRMDTSWIRMTRRWTLVSWIFLLAGFTLGGMWAYEELGWGGYWAWDPVENASFMPWLIATAFIHSVMITEKKGMLKNWNFILILAAFELSIFGTFITRSGVVSSVHSFALSNVGPFFVLFLAISTFFGIFWIFYRSSELRSEQRMRSFLSREASFLLNNLLFVSICFAVFWGTVFPMLTEWVQGEKVTIAAPFFNKVSLPLAGALLVLTGICPLIAWRKASGKNFRRNFLYPLTGGFLSGAAVFAAGITQFYPLLFFSGCGFVALTVFFEFYKGARARQVIRPTGFLVALRDLTLMNKRRYGGFIIHMGFVLAILGIIASSFYNMEHVFTVQSGQSFVAGDYTLALKSLDQRTDPEKDVVTARLDVFRDGEKIGEVLPEKHFHHKSEQPMTEVAVRSGWAEDLYVVLSGWDAEGNVSFHVFINPLVQVIWAGIAIMVLGGVFVLFPNRKPAAVALKKPQEEARDEAA
ncbi:MAG: heme lyase CcmF/NrfE family subunit [Acidobacteriota bacterium]